MKGWDAKQPDGLPEDAITCPICGALPCDQVNNPDEAWRPIDTMPEGKWVFVFVPGAGPGFAAIKKPTILLKPLGAPEEDFWSGRIIGLERGKEIHQATHWRPCFLPPVEHRPSMVSEHTTYEAA